MPDIAKRTAGIITPAPYFRITFNCSNRAFYSVKDRVIKIAEAEDIEWNDGYLSEHCDYEGDLEEIRLYRGDREDKLTFAVLDYYGVEDVPDDMIVCLSIC